jgi:hypothetical protein
VVSSRVAKPYSDCTDIANFRSELADVFLAQNKTYQQKVCFQMCKQRHVIQKCGCSHMQLPRLSDSAQPCLSFQQFACGYNASFELKPKSDDTCKGLCPLECKTIDFELSTSHDAFPAPGIYTQSLRDCAELQSTFWGVNADLAGMPYEELANSLACVYLYYEDMKFTSIVEEPTISVVQSLANVGGSLGLFIGASFLTIGEVFECLVEILIVLVNSKQNKAKSAINQFI